VFLERGGYGVGGGKTDGERWRQSAKTFSEQTGGKTLTEIRSVVSNALVSQSNWSARMTSLPTVNNARKAQYNSRSVTAPLTEIKNIQRGLANVSEPVYTINTSPGARVYTKNGFPPGPKHTPVRTQQEDSNV
jgi:hypothetical protein